MHVLVVMQRCTVFICTISAFWFVLDTIILVVALQSDDLKAEGVYFTTQVWIFGIFSKFAFILVYRLENQRVHSSTTTIEWISTNKAFICFRLYGTLQTAVLFTFFALLAMDSTILTYAMEEHNVSVIISWNHLRHVTPVIFYMMISPFLSAYLSSRMQITGKTFDTNRFRLALTVICSSLFLGALHHVFFDDAEIYMYKGGHRNVGRNCIFTFIISVVLSTLYYTYGFV